MKTMHFSTPSRWSKAFRRALPLLLGLLAASGVAQLRAAREYEVAKPSEDIRAHPEGRLLGSLLEGSRVEETGRDGRWVKFQLEAWIWGPSLEGFETDGPDETRKAPRVSATADDETDPPRRARAALSVHLDDVRELVDERFGRFYGMRLDPDLEQVQVRFRVRDLDPLALERRQMQAQYEIFALLEGEVGFASLRIETNRPNGSGEVGIEVAVTSVDDIRRIAGDDVALWRMATRRSSDGGSTWTEPE